MQNMLGPILSNCQRGSTQYINPVVSPFAVSDLSLRFAEIEDAIAILQNNNRFLKPECDSFADFRRIYHL